MELPIILFVSLIVVFGWFISPQVLGYVPEEDGMYARVYRIVSNYCMFGGIGFLSGTFLMKLFLHIIYW